MEKDSTCARPRSVCIHPPSVLKQLAVKVLPLPLRAPSPVFDPPWHFLPLGHCRRATPVARNGTSAFRAGESGARVHRIGVCIGTSVRMSCCPPPEIAVFNLQSRQCVDLRARQSLDSGLSKLHRIMLVGRLRVYLWMFNVNDDIPQSDLRCTWPEWKETPYSRTTHSLRRRPTLP